MANLRSTQPRRSLPLIRRIRGPGVLGFRECRKSRLIGTIQPDGGPFQRTVLRTECLHADGFPVADARLHGGPVLHSGNARRRLRKRRQPLVVSGKHRVDSTASSRAVSHARAEAFGFLAWRPQLHRNRTSRTPRADVCVVEIPRTGALLGPAMSSLGIINQQFEFGKFTRGSVTCDTHRAKPRTT